MTGAAWWSQTAAENASKDPTINWAEGQAPSSINDSGRAEMASFAKWRDDTGGSIVTGGSATAYTVASYQNFDTLSRLDGQLIAFTAHATNGVAATLNVDGLGAKPLRSSPGVALLAGVVVQGTPYLALYNDADGAFYLHGLFGNPWQIPIGSIIDHTSSTVPNSSFIQPYGQAISRTTYATYFQLIGTFYGGGDGSTTFNVPDCRGRVIAGYDAMGGNAAGRLTTVGIGPGGGGSETVTLSAGQIPTITSSVSGSASVTVAPGSFNLAGTTGVVTEVSIAAGGGGITLPIRNSGSNWQSINSIGGGGSISGSATSNNTSGGAHSNIPPTIVMYKLLRII